MGEGEVKKESGDCTSVLRCVTDRYASDTLRLHFKSEALFQKQKVQQTFLCPWVHRTFKKRERGRKEGEKENPQLSTVLVIDSMLYENGGLNDVKITVLAGSSILCLLCKVINQTSVACDEEFHHTLFAGCQKQILLSVFFSALGP